MFKIGLENRDFCKSLHFYIVDAGKKKKKKKKKKKTSCICWLVQLLSALRAEDIALRAMPSLFVFLVLRGACQRPDICIYPITLNGYIYSPGKKIEKIKKNRKNLKKLKIIGTISGALARSLIPIYISINTLSL